jgi:CHAD domain-containing protein
MMKRQEIATPPEVRGVKAGSNGHEAALAGRLFEPLAVPTPSERPGRHSGTHSDQNRNDGLNAMSRAAERREAWLRIRKLALRQLNRLVSLEPKVLRDEFPEAVHDLRVASRRLQSWLDFLYPPPRPPQIRKLRRRLKQAREALGELRNHDVLAARMARILARKRAARREAWEAGHEYVLTLRTKTVERAHWKLTRLNLAQVYLRLREQLEASPPPVDGFRAASDSPRFPAAPDGRSDSATAERAEDSKTPSDPAARFAERLAELWKHFDALAAKSRRDPGVLHPLRIAAKRLRYLVEVAAALEMAGSADALHWLRELQGKLGDWHDLEVLDDTLIDMLAHRKFLRSNLPLAIEVEKLILGLRRSKTRQSHRYLRKTLQSRAFHQTAAWVNDSVAARSAAIVR